MRQIRLAVVLIVVLFAVPAFASAATVKVRVEGKTRTLFGPTGITVQATTPLQALEEVAVLGEFYYHVTDASFGQYVDQIGLYPASASSGWVFKVDNVSPPVGAAAVTLENGDQVLWYYATFGPAGGPPTLDLTSSNGCYTVHAYADDGKPAPVSGVVVHVGSKRAIATTTGAAVCPGPHRGVLVRATATGAIRSNALR
jgi:Domain of unknown function (DUF4430)